MRTRSSSNLVGNSSSNPTTSNPKRRNRRRSNQRVEPFALEESPVVTMADQRTMAELLRAPTEGYAEAIVVPPILAEHFELKHSLINMMTSDQFFGLEKDNPHDHIRWFNKITSTIKYKDVPNHAIKLMLFPFSLARAACRSTQDVLTIIENKSKIRNSQNKSVFSQVKLSDGNSSSSDIAKLTHAVNQQMSVVTTAMTAILKQFQDTPPPASVKAVEEICVTCGGPHPYYQCLAADGNTFPEYRDNIQGYVAAATGNYNQGNAGYRPLGVVNQTRPPGFVQQNRQNNQNYFNQPQRYNRGNNFNQNANYQAPIQQNQNVPLSELEKFKKMNDVNMKAMQAQINNVKNELRNEMQSSIQASMSNQTNELKNMMASFFQMNTASTSGTGSLPSNTVANPKGELKAITTRSGLVLDGPTVPMPLPFINPEEDECVEETLTDSEHGEYTIKVPPSQVQKAKPPSQRNFVIHQRDPRYPHIPYPLRMNQEKQKEKDEYQKMLKSLLSNKEKLIELANTPLNENCSAVILKKLPEKLGDPRKFLIPCGFNELKCKALADLGIAKDVFVPVGKFTFPFDFVIVDFESDPCVPFILGRPFLRTARALIDVHGEEMILR
ncbi:reverse transcriptase domain-containing protein [Tanacetum coccineum]